MLTYQERQNYMILKSIGFFFFVWSIFVHLKAVQNKLSYRVTTKVFMDKFGGRDGRTALWLLFRFIAVLLLKKTILTSKC